MKIIKAGVDFIPMPTDKDSLLKHIERCGRVCYKSEDKIAEGSAEKFIAGIIKRGHGAVLEHGAIILQTGYFEWSLIQERIQWLESHNFVFNSFLRFTGDADRYIRSGNIRAWRDFLFAYTDYHDCIPGFTRILNVNYPELFSEFKYEDVDAIGGADRVIELHVSDLVTENERMHHQYQTLLFTCDRGVSHELVRHRPSSFCQESTRYCNYSKDGFGNEITVIEPLFFTRGTDTYRMWECSCENSEIAYFGLLNAGRSPQEARSVLPNSLKTELMMTATLGEWRHIINLRCDVAAHPQAREVSKIALRHLHDNCAGMFDDQMEVFGYGE